MGADIAPHDDGFVVAGPTALSGAPVDSRGDHRLAMALTIAGLLADGETVVHNTDCIADSFPGFEERLFTLANQQ
jgi:3-phosphoshikimate 1-carboxyvinyltransferase